MRNAMPMTNADINAAIDNLTAKYQALADRLAAIDSKLTAAPSGKLAGDAGKSLVAEVKAKLGLTSVTLASMVGVSPRTVQGWELGRPISIIAQRAMQTLA
jgi:DNA-binding transcriptional regulator YiaG